MSYSVTFIGTPEKIVEALEEYSTKISGPSKEEYENALPSIVALVKLNKSTYPSLLKVGAYGHASSVEGKVIQSTCGVIIESVNGTLV